MFPFSSPADCRRVGITLLLTACMFYPVMLRATEADLSVRATVEGTAPVPQEESPAVNESAATVDLSAALETGSRGDQASLESEIGGSDDLDMPIVEAAQTTDDVADLASPPEQEADDSAVDEAASELAGQSNELLSTSNDPRELSVAPGKDPLLPDDAPNWVGATPQLHGDTHTLVVASMPTLKRTRVDAELDMPLCKTVIDYVKHDLANDHQDVDLSQYITADYIRKNLIDAPEGYIAEIATSNGPMYQKWVKVNITPEQQKQLNSWYVQAVQSKRLPPIGFGLAGLLGVVGLSHLLLRRKHASATQLVHVEPSTQPAASNHRGVAATLIGMGLIGSGIVAVGLFATVAGVRTRQTIRAVEIDKVHSEQAQAAAMAEAERARAEAARALERIPSVHSDFADPSDLFELPADGGRPPKPPAAPDYPVEVRSSSAELPNANVTTTINSNGNQQIIIRTRSR